MHPPPPPVPPAFPTDGCDAMTGVLRQFSAARTHACTAMALSWCAASFLWLLPRLWVSPMLPFVNHHPAPSEVWCSPILLPLWLRWSMDHAPCLRLDAVIVRVMKSRRAMEHRQLVADVIDLLKGRFQPSPDDIKKRIESLIEREYMERSQQSRCVQPTHVECEPVQSSRRLACREQNECWACLIPIHVADMLGGAPEGYRIQWHWPCNPTEPSHKYTRSSKPGDGLLNVGHLWGLPIRRSQSCSISFN